MATRAGTRQRVILGACFVLPASEESLMGTSTTCLFDFLRQQDDGLDLASLSFIIILFLIFFSLILIMILIKIKN